MYCLLYNSLDSWPIHKRLLLVLHCLREDSGGVCEYTVVEPCLEHGRRGGALSVTQVSSPLKMQQVRLQEPSPQFTIAIWVFSLHRPS